MLNAEPHELPIDLSFYSYLCLKEAMISVACLSWLHAASSVFWVYFTFLIILFCYGNTIKFQFLLARCSVLSMVFSFMFAVVVSFCYSTVREH